MTPSEANNNAFISSLGELFERDKSLEPIGPFEERRIHEINEAFQALFDTVTLNDGQETIVAQPIIEQNVEIVAPGPAVYVEQAATDATQEPEITISSDGTLSVEDATKAAYAAHDDSATVQAPSFVADNDQFAIG